MSAAAGRMESYMQYQDYKREEVSELGRAIYKEKIKRLVEPMENGKFIAID